MYLLGVLHFLSNLTFYGFDNSYWIEINSLAFPISLDLTMKPSAISNKLKPGAQCDFSRPILVGCWKHNIKMMWYSAIKKWLAKNPLIIMSETRIMSVQCLWMKHICVYFINGPISYLSLYGKRKPNFESFVIFRKPNEFNILENKRIYNHFLIQM